MAKEKTRWPKRRRAWALAAALAIGVPGTAWATMAVVDTAALGQMAEQLGRLQQQIDLAMQNIDLVVEQIEVATDQLTAITKLSNQAQEQIDAIGQMGKISLPVVNIQKLQRQIARDSQCLAPDFSDLMPGMKLDDLDVDTICEGRRVYGEALWFDPEDPSTWQLPEGVEMEDLSTEQQWEWRDRAEENVRQRRTALLRRTTTEGLAQADLAVGDRAETNRLAVEELEAAAAAAATQQDRLAVIGRGLVLANQQQAQQNQLLAQMLRVQSAALMRMGLVEGGAMPDETDE